MDSYYIHRNFQVRALRSLQERLRSTPRRRERLQAQDSYVSGTALDSGHVMRWQDNTSKMIIRR